MRTSLGFKAKASWQKYKKARHAIRIFSEKDISKIIKDFEKIEKLPYEKKRPKHEPTESYFHLARQLAECMMRSDNLNWYDHNGYTKMTAPLSNVNVTNECESKRSIVNEKLPQSCATNENKSKRSIVNEPLSQKCSADENELSSTKEYKSECAIKKLKDTKNEVACNMTNILTFLTYLNVEETILTCHVRERACLLKTMNNLRTFLRL